MKNRNSDCGIWKRHMGIQVFELMNKKKKSKEAIKGVVHYFGC